MPLVEGVQGCRSSDRGDSASSNETTRGAGIDLLSCRRR